MIKINDYDKIMSDRNLFNGVVYTPLSEALKLLEERSKNKELLEKVNRILGGDVPEVLTGKHKFAVLFRQIATPNYETRRFMALAKENGLRPLFFEYLDDKFTPENEFKHSLGQLHVQRKKDRKGYSQIERISIVDFPSNSGKKKLREMKTLWNEPLTDFHRKLFSAYDYNLNDFDFYDSSPWLKAHGNKPVNYYPNFFLLLTCHGILFENFLLCEAEREFSKNIILPAIEKVMNLTGIKPLIVPIEPIDMEVDKYWISHDKKVKSSIPKV